jgi:hypothetical protein
MKLIIYLVLLSGLGLTCSGNREETSRYTRLNYGNSFGMCVGYCIFVAELNPEMITYTRKGGGSGVNLPQKNCTIEITTVQWENIINALDTEEFLKLPAVIGCPDCADGGAEWLQITTPEGLRHRVTFEYGKYPDPVKAIMAELTQLKEQSEQCNDF